MELIIGNTRLLDLVAAALAGAEALRRRVHRARDRRLLRPGHQRRAAGRAFALAASCPVLKVDGETIWDSMAICGLVRRALSRGAAVARRRPRPLAGPVGGLRDACRLHGPAHRVRHGAGRAAIHTMVGPDRAAAADQRGRRRRHPPLRRHLWREMRARFGAGGPYLFGEWSMPDAFFTPVAARIPPLPDRPGGPRRRRRRGRGLCRRPAGTSRTFSNGTELAVTAALTGVTPVNETCEPALKANGVMVLSEPETAVMSAPPTIRPDQPAPPQAQRRPTLMAYGAVHPGRLLPVRVAGRQPALGAGSSASPTVRRPPATSRPARPAGHRRRRRHSPARSAPGVCARRHGVQRVQRPADHALIDPVGRHDLFDVFARLRHVDRLDQQQRIGVRAQLAQRRPASGPARRCRRPRRAAGRPGTPAGPASGSHRPGPAAC